MSDNTELYAALKTRAYDCTVKEFKELLLKFGNDEQALDAMTKGVKERIKHESDHDYASDWRTLDDKEALLVDCRLGVGAFKGAFNETAAKKSPTAEPSLETISRQLDDISRRLERLEGAKKLKSPHHP